MTPIVAGCGCWADVFYYVGVVIALGAIVWVADRYTRDKYRD